MPELDSQMMEAHKAMQAAMKQFHVDAPTQIEEKVSRLEGLLQAFNPLDVMAQMSFSHIMTNPETYTEVDHEGSQGHVEYLTLVSLTSPYREGEGRLINGPDFEAIDKLVRDIIFSTIWYYGTENADPTREEPPDVLQELRFKTILNEFLVRNPGYPQHLEDVLEALFGGEPAASWMMKTLGFTIEDAIGFARSIGDMITQRLLRRRDRAREMEAEWMREVRGYRRSGVQRGVIPENLLQSWANLSDRKVRRQIRNAVIGWTFLAVGDTCSFTTNDLAAASGATEGRARSFLDAFSLDFGSVPSRFRLPQATHPLQRRPIVRHPRGYLCPVPQMISWALRPGLEAMLNPGSEDARGATVSTWEGYQKARGSYLVKEAVRLIAEGLRSEKSYEGLKYTLNEEGRVETYDLDGLVLFDRMAFLVEGKAGQFRPAARRGAPKGMIEDLKKLVAEPHEQALRARRYIEHSASPVFETKDGQVVSYDKNRHATSVLVTVSLEPLDSFVTTLHHLEGLGIFSEGELPWAVQLLDLRVISELTEFPSQFVHYLQRRLRLNDLKKIAAHDELDWFGNYVSEGLYFDNVLAEKKADLLTLASYTTAIDAYYMHQAGIRKAPAPKPRQPMPEVFRQLLTELEKNDGEGYVSVATTLLDLGGKERKLVAKHIVRCRVQSVRDRKMHDFSLEFADWGLTVVSMPGLPEKDFASRLQILTQVKKYRSKKGRWVTLGTNPDLSDILHGWVAVEGPWIESADLDQAVKLLLPGKRSRGS